MNRRIRPHVNPLSITHEHSFEGFGNAHGIWVDVGACKGEFIYALAEQFPEKNFLVFEIRRPLFTRLVKLFEGMKDRVQVFDGDAGRNLLSILDACRKQGAKIEKIFINFPDPWPKAKHHKRRFVSPAFLKTAEAFFTAETEFVFQTDQEPLFRDTLEYLKESAFRDVELFEASPFGVQTDWEAAKVREGEKIYRMRFRKTSL